MKKTLLSTLIGLSILPTMLYAQASTKEPFKDNYGSGLKVNLSDDGSKYVRFLFMNQVWFRTGTNNPNTMVNGELSEHSTDISLRRSRVIAYSQISDRFLILTHFGINNQSFANTKKPGLFMHDAYAEYAIVPDFDRSRQKKNDFSLYFGGGIHLWNGVSRLTSSSTLNMMTLDAPILNWPLIDNSDQFGRQLGLYIKGNARKFGYQFNMSQPFAQNNTPTYNPTKGRIAVDNNGNSKLAFQGYVDYQFLDKESNLLPFRVGTYLGEKRVFNIGAGFYHQADGTKSVDQFDVVKKHDINQFAVDIYGDLPVGEKSRKAAISFYGSYYRYDFGPNYYRNIGILNNASGVDPNAAPGTTSFNGVGNSRVMVGTGNLLYTHLGYLLPKTNPYQKCRVMPYVAYTMKDLEITDQISNNFYVGANLFLNGHNAKITAQYSTRPLYFQENNKYVVKDHRGEFIVQLHVFL